MKWLLYVVIATVGTVAVQGDTLVDANRLCLGIVVDRSASSQWSELPLMGSQAITALKEGELVKVITAETGPPILYATSKIGSQQTPSRNDIYAFLGHLKPIGWGGQADLARAVSTAFGELDRCGPTFKFALLVITDGKLSDEQVRQIRNLATAYKARGWPMCITADRNAHSDIFLAASQGEFKVMLLNHANIDLWLDSIRPNKATEKMTNSSLDSAPDRKSTAKTQDQLGANIADGNQLRILNALQKDVNEVKATVKQISEQPAKENTIVVPPDDKSVLDPNEVQRLDGKQDSSKSAPLKTEISDAMAEKGRQIVGGVRSDSNTTVRAEPDKADEKAGATKDKKNESTLTLILSWLRKYIVLLILIFVVLPAIVIAIVIYIYRKDKKAADRIKQELNSQTAVGQQLCQRLVCYVGEQLVPIGDLGSFREIIIGSGTGSSVFIDNEAVESQHLKIINSGVGLQIKNLASTPVHINGRLLDSKKSCPLDMPADIQLTAEISITLLLEPVELEKEATHEQQTD